MRKNVERNGKGTEKGRERVEKSERENGMGKGVSGEREKRECGESFSSRIIF